MVKLRKQGVAAALAAVCMMSLSGCGGKGEIKEGMYYDATGICPDAILLTVNDREIPADRYFYWLTYNCEYAAEHLGSKLDWAQLRTVAEETPAPAAGGETEGSTEEKKSEKESKKEKKPKEETLDDYVKRMALNNTVLYSIVEEWAELYAVELTAEDKMAMAQDYQNRCDSYSGEEEYLKSLAEKGVTPTLAESFSRDYYLYQRLYAFFQEEDSPIAPPDGALDTYAKEHQLCTVDYIFVSTEDYADDPAALALRRERADMVLRQLNSNTNPPADFYMVMEAYSDRKDFSNKGLTFAPGESGFGDAFEAEAAKLAEWQYSDHVIEGPDGFYILRGRAVDTNAVSQEYFAQMLADAAAAAKVTPSRAYKKISSEAFYTKMNELRTGEPPAAEEE